MCKYFKNFGLRIYGVVSPPLVFLSVLIFLAPILVLVSETEGQVAPPVERAGQLRVLPTPGPIPMDKVTPIPLDQVPGRSQLKVPVEQPGNRMTAAQLRSQYLSEASLILGHLKAPSVDYNT